MIKIGSIEIQDQAGFDLRVARSEIAPKAILRTKNGRGIDTSRWSKTRLSFACSGWIPDGLHSLNLKQVVDIHCVDWLSTSAASNVITIPCAFRTDDYAPQGLAFVNDEMKSTAVALSGSVATLTLVPGATVYHVSYCEILTSIITLVDRQFDDQNGVWSWALEAEEQ